MADYYADECRGVYIPQYFAQSCNREMVTGVDQEDWEALEAGPENEQYWDAWDDVIRNATITSPDGKEGFLYQDGGLWIIWGDDDPDYKDIFHDC